ncbi:calcium-binding protein [Kribbella catacumbae]|uniref:calcium-binding protein n=1 Tax=Kribbella catacumbae TaxID=460086 RepID=UPI00037B1EBB|nr:calcium-binding protein [Kribbella catacumbae]
MKAQAGRVNNISVTQKEDRLIVHDTRDTVAASPTCTTIDAQTVACPSRGIFHVIIDAGDLNDQVTFDAADEFEALTGTLLGGPGDDVLALGPSATTGHLFGGQGNDLLKGGKSNDFLDGGEGADEFSGGGGTDFADYSNRDAPVVVKIDDTANDGKSGEGDNVHTDVENVIGGLSDDVLVGSRSNNNLNGGPGRDQLFGELGDDALTGGLGDDSLNGGPGSDDLFGAEGDDSLEGGSGTDSDFFEGGDGADTVSYSNRPDDIVADNNGQFDDGGNAGNERDNVRPTVESIRGGAGNDKLSITAPGSALVRNVLSGDRGNDRLVVRDGGPRDIAEGGPGTNSCVIDPDDKATDCQLGGTALRHP